MDAKTFTEAMYLAKTIFGEARGTGRVGMNRIAWVIRNRRDHPQHPWGRSIASVVTWPWQFSCWNKNDPNREKLAHPMGLSGVDQLAWLMAVEEALAVLEAPESKNPFPGVYWYHDRSIDPPTWAKQLIPVRIGELPQFTFYKARGSA